LYAGTITEVASGPATIGEFYTALAKAFEVLAPAIDPNAFSIERGSGAFRIASVQDALIPSP